MPKEALKELGPTLTSELALHLSQKNKISPETARKRIQRATENSEIKILDTINFAHNQSLAYLPEQFGTRLYHERLFSAMSAARSALRLPLAAMRARGGSVPNWLFPTIAGCPITAKVKQDSPKMKAKLVELGFLAEEGDYVHLTTVQPSARLKPIQIEARINVENSFLTTFGEWLKRQRFVGNQMSLRFDGQPPQFGYHQWDLVAPSYIAPIATRTKDKASPGFVVADVILGRAVNEYEVQYFIEKCANIRAHKNNRPFLAFLVADWFEPAALTLAQSAGVMFTTPKNLFGQRYSESLEEFRRVLEAKEKELEEQAIQISTLLKKIQNVELLEGMNSNLRGRLFEVIIGHCFIKQHGGTVLHGKHFKDPNDPKKDWDCDVLQLTPGSFLRACECKGYAGSTMVTVDDVKKWFSIIVPIIRTHYGSQDYPEQEFSFWTSGTFEDDAMELLKQIQGTCKKYHIAFKTGDELATLIEQVGDPTIKAAYKLWFRRRLKKRKEQAA